MHTEQSSNNSLFRSTKSHKEKYFVWRLKISGPVMSDVEFAASKFIAVAKTHGIKVSVIPLPTQIKKFTVLSAPFIYKRSMVAYKRAINVRAVYIYLIDNSAIKNFSSIALPNGVQMVIKMPEAQQSSKERKITTDKGNNKAT